MTLQRDDVDAGLLQLGKGLLILPPLRAQGLFPVRIGLDAVAIADVYGRFTLEPLQCPLQRGDAPVVHLIKEHVKRRLIKLDDIDTCRLQLPGFLIENLGKFPRQFFPAFIVGIIQRIDHGHRARQRPLDRLTGLLTQEPGILNKHRLLARHSAHHGRHARIIAITNSYGFALLEINAAEVLDKGRHKVLAGLLTITDDIDAGQLLFVQCQTQRILLALDQLLPLQLPG